MEGSKNVILHALSEECLTYEYLEATVTRIPQAQLKSRTRPPLHTSMHKENHCTSIYCIATALLPTAPTYMEKS